MLSVDLLQDWAEAYYSLLQLDKYYIQFALKP